MKLSLAAYRKSLIAVLAVLAQLVSIGVLNGNAEHIVSIVLAAAAAIGVYAAPNAVPAFTDVAPPPPPV